MILLLCVGKKGHGVMKKDPLAAVASPAHDCWQRCNARKMLSFDLILVVGDVWKPVHFYSFFNVVLTLFEQRFH